MPELRCVYCGCSDSRACVIDIDHVPRDMAILLEPHEKERGSVACWWVQERPPVCSAPRCMAALAHDTPRLVPIAPGARPVKCRHCQTEEVYLVPHQHPSARKHGRLISVTVNVRLGIAPTETTPGQGIPHARRCSAGARRMPEVRRA